MIGTQEIVMYNKLGEHEMTVHNQDLLRIASENIRRGYHAVADLPNPHWKFFTLTNYDEDSVVRQTEGYAANIALAASDG